MGRPPIINTVYLAKNVCSGSVCSVTPNVPLAHGASYRWFIRPGSSRGDAPWNATTVFSIATTVPGTATLGAPVGAGADASPAYSWNAVPGSSWYYLWVQPTDGAPMIQKWYEAKDVCGATTCTINPSINLPGGKTFRWWIQAYNDLGYGPWSAPQTFSR
jgi:hypothetical protein